MAIIDEYKKAIDNRIIIRGHFAKSFVPRPKIEDFQRGFIIRYFAKQRNNSRANIVEIDRSQFVSHSESVGGLNTTFYKVISLKWKIIGSLEKIQAVNFFSVKNAETLMQGITKRIGNLLQFASIE